MIMFMSGVIFGILAYIYVPKLINKIIIKKKKQFQVTFTIMYFSHPLEVGKKGEFIRMRPITTRVEGDDEEDAISLVRDVVYDGVKVEIDSVEEIRFKHASVDIGGSSVNYSPKNFMMSDGSPLPETNWKNTSSTIQISFQEMQKFPSTVKVGDILVCKRDRYKSLAPGGKYRVSDVRSVERGTTFKWITVSVRFEGHTRYIAMNGYAFRHLEKGESREIALNGVFGDDQQSFAVDPSLRKIDIMGDMNKSLMEVLSKSILDKSRHHLGVIDWACEKSCKDLGVNPDDFKKLLKMPLGKILKMIENK